MRRRRGAGVERGEADLSGEDVAVTPHYSRSQITITRTTRLFWFGCGIGGLSMNSRSPSKRMKRVCSPPTQASFQVHLGDHLAVLDPVAAGVGDHGAQRLRALLVGFRNRPPLGG